MRQHIRHACDSCKRRKTRCDGDAPQCSSCRALRVECQFSIPQAKRGPRSKVSKITSTRATESYSTPNPNGSSERPPNGSSGDVGKATSPIVDLVGTSSSWSVGDLITTPNGRWPATPQTVLMGWHGNSPRDLHEHLTSTVESMGMDLELLIRRCVDLWIENVFPIVPIFGPAIVMSSIPLLLPAARHHFDPTLRTPESGNSGPHGSSLDDMRLYTLITAACASVLSRTHDENNQKNHDLVRIFLSSSRGMLLCYEDADIALPNLYSPLIRLVLSGVMHGQGKNRMSRFLAGHAIRLGVDMRLFDERTYENLDAQESQIRRNLAWALYTVDKSLSILNNLPPTIWDRLEDPTRLDIGPDGTPVRLLDGMTDLKYQPPYESSLRQGFDLASNQWLVAGDIVRGLDLLSRLQPGQSSEPDGVLALAKNVTQSYTTFCSLLDLSPSWMNDPEVPLVGGEEEAAHAQQKGLWSQRANLIVNNHALKLIFMVKASNLGYPVLLGLTEDEELCALRNTEVAGELMKDVARIPLSALRANGEAMVEKLRRVGVILLEISHRISNEAIATRAKAIFTRLLDLISRLNSRSSDNLDGEAP